MSLLDKIILPSDLRKLAEHQLPKVADELRNFIIQTLNKCGGHFAANLGTVELSVALHYLYNTPDDKLIWDVGHQAYPHKILTGRKHQLHTIRKDNGLAPFPSRDESNYDAFGVGHSSTSISAALGMSLANKMQNKSNKTVAIIGDGAMTAGLAFEALNHAGDSKVDMLVIMNDNDMSISSNVGALSNYVARILGNKLYLTMRNGSKKVLSLMPSVSELARRTETHLKGMMVPGTLFEELGFNYIGPIDGHSLPTLLKTLNNIKNLPGPQFLHILTKKGKGLAEAEADPIKYHAVKPGFLDAIKLNKSNNANSNGVNKLNTQPTSTTNLSEKKLNKSRTYSEIFGDWLCDMAAADQKLVAITPAMKEGSCLVEFAEKFPERYIDVGIAEQHSVTVAAGLACEGMKPVIAIYSTFLQRAYDQLIHDVALQNLNVLFALDRAGIVGGDGATHNGAFDLSYLACIPNMIIMAAANENELRQMLYTGYMHDGPVAVRYPRGIGPESSVEQTMHSIEIGKAKIERNGKQIAILAVGSMLENAKLAAQQLDATLLNLRFIKPLDENMILQLAKTHTYIVTIEENAIAGGVGQKINSLLQNIDQKNSVLNIGLPDKFIEHGSPKKILEELQLSPIGILQQITKHFSYKNCKLLEKLVELVEEV